jgi:hypothetical protein
MELKRIIHLSLTQRKREMVSTVSKKIYGTSFFYFRAVLFLYTFFPFSIVKISTFTHVYTQFIV